MASDDDVRGVAVRPGSRVQVTRSLYSLFRIAVPRGTAGTVEQIRDYGTIVVRFDNGRWLGVSETFLVPVAADREPHCPAAAG